MTQTPDIVAFFIGGVVSVEKSGPLLKALYEAGGNDMKCEPVFAAVASNKRQPKAIGAPVTNGASAVLPRLTVAEAVYKMITDNGTMHRQEMIRGLDQLGHTGKNVSTALRNLVTQDKIKRVGNALYAPTTQKKPADIGATISGHQLNILAAIKKAGKPVNRAWIVQHAGVQPNSLGATLNVMIGKGTIVRTAKDSYALA